MKPNTKNIRPKVLFVTYEYKDKVYGGIGRVINGLSASLANDIDFDVFLLEWNNLSMVFSGTIFLGGDKKEKFWRKHYKVIHQLIKKNNYDIVHFLHSGAEAYTCIKFLREKNTNAKLIFSCHSLAKHEQDIRKNSDKDIFYEDFILKNIDHIHLLNESSKKWLQKKYDQTVLDKPIQVIANGININDYQNTSSDFIDVWKSKINKEKNLVILCMSRWSHGKGIEHLLKAIPEVIRQIPNIKFIIAGRKQSSWENKVEDYVKEIDYLIAQSSEWAIPMGWVNDIERNSLLHLADICVMPSEMEYFPYSILEPMASKVPIISSALSCVEEMLEKDKECLYFNPTQVSELANEIVRLANSPNMRQSISDKAFEKVSHNYRWEDIAQQYAKFYSDILKKNKL